ncbi:MAG: Rrf2 family transcriptional regulator [Candidatus Pseudobacter hemicellulosilyticus]|uniref:Rrf2 family transcriptional regulator n=1 Tax=Candidatus Pseudobacter hemicellulosilyticus TaxID=3121375 RepID=A0AAJ6BGA6_9BACT|nr:MAG: Rrf2 family transcriptional regulator [Pseudobacter sp.]
MLSVTCKTAIKAVLYLAAKADTGTNAGIREIAGAINASEHTVGKLLQTLVKDQLIHSLKGPAGGFYMSGEQLKRPIIDIISAIDGDALFTSCALGLEQCSSSHPCPIHQDYMGARELLRKSFSRKKIADLRNLVKEGVVHLA